jgi:ADP-ribose pyrophosphatase
MKKYIIKPQLLNQQIIFENKYMTVKTDSLLMKREQDDNILKTNKEYYLVDCPDCVCCVVQKDDKLLFVNQYRYPIGNFDTEVVAGMIDEGDTPEQAIIKELEEEAGIVTDNVTFLGKIHQCPGLLSNAMHVFYCNDFEQKEKKLEEFEKFVNLTTVWLTPSEVTDMIANNKITDATTLSALYMTGKCKD